LALSNNPSLNVTYCYISETWIQKILFHKREPENVTFMSSFPLYTGKYYTGKMRLPFIDKDLLYRGAH
jgi:hypothetical protein